MRIEENIYRVPIPVPFPMKYIFCYLFKDYDGWSLVDTGFNYPDAKDAWKKVFSELKINPKEIHSIYLTHFHPDHFGLAGWMQEQTGAEAFISREEFEMIKRVWGKDSKQVNHIATLFKENGVPDDLIEKIKENMNKLKKHVSPMPKLTIMNGKQITLGERNWLVISTPGHSDGLICFYQPEKKLLLVADHILDPITPNISLWPGCRPNPLQDYLHSLQKVSSLNVEMALPAHGEIIYKIQERIKEIRLHHEKRLLQMSSLAKGGQTAFQIAYQVFGHKNLTSHQWRFAIAETLAHLEFSVSINQLGKLKKEKNILYQLIDHISA